MNKYFLLQDKCKTLLVNYIDTKNFKKYSDKYFNRGKLIDIGCGTKPHENYLSEKVDLHVGVDHEISMHDQSNVDISGTAYNIPVNDGEFDYALCNAVLEHLEEPRDAIKECNRVLSQNGIAMYTVPFFWHLHEEPRDFFRYTKFGLKYLFEKEGFEIIELKPVSGFWIMSSTMLVYYLDRFNISIIKWTGVITIINLLIQLLAFTLDKIKIKTVVGEEWTIMYTIIARKK